MIYNFVLLGYFLDKIMVYLTFKNEKFLVLDYFLRFVVNNIILNYNLMYKIFMSLY